MANIKVTYGTVSRRLAISSTTTWSEIETQFRNLFNIPKELQMMVSYTDEEGDVITLSSDLEFQEVLSNYSNNIIKFVLTTSIVNNSNDNNVLNDREKSTDTIIDDETSNLINGVSSIHIEDSNNNQTTSKYRHVTITDETNDPLFNQQQETTGENSKSAAESNNNDNEKNPSVEESQNQENNDDDEPDEIIVIITRNPWSHRRRERFGGCNPYYTCYTFGGRSRHGYHSDNYTNGCNRNASSRGYGCGRHHRRRHHISSEVLTEKMNTLHSMGFFNDNLEELVRRYNGNLESVIEFLLSNQQSEQNNKRVAREENSEKDQPMEIEEENNRPYVL
ncbi:hypothetical protein RclHR1_03220014 [Rhizophagus clarus]|uniref:PB1 domain-containing protein n=1 Tax=Rhizophagus clarus TaxID=94130 RepID=A0A2Z6RPD7_9GLOM|nr:hypothetical protein RclHR1_03220014 [Rhizophagus clarus]GES93991.1 hypothetical protein GLOIN_2v1499009 [Rhizophagus clarus]